MSSTPQRYAKLVMVTAGNNNKYYEMTYEGGSTFHVKYGRIDSTAQTGSYPYSQWTSKYNEKVRKGYKDVTDMVSTKVDEKQEVVELEQLTNAKVDTFMSLMKKYTDKLVSSTYSVKYENVTQKQVDTAQSILNDIKNLDKNDEHGINQKLIELYMIIPRYMSQVGSHLLPNIKLDRHLVQEQDNLDAMSSQVQMYKPQEEKPKKEKLNLLDVLGIEMEEATDTSDIDYILKQMGRIKVQTVFKVKKDREEKVFDKWMKDQKNKSTRHLIHGTRCTSVIPIIEQGLKIRPTGNFQFSGKVYGDGNYFSEVVTKSWNYTGYDQDVIFFVFEVHTGNPFVYEGWYKGNSFPLNYKELSARGFDSTHVNAGNGLLNSEIIAYREEQCQIKYIIWMKR